MVGHVTDADYRQRAAITKRGHSRLAILKAARQLFGERGWEATTLSAVAKEAGVSVATLHNHFKTKNELIARVFGGVMAVIIEDGQHLLDETGDLEKTIKWMFDTLVETSIKRRNITAAMVAAMLEVPLVYPEVEIAPGSKLPEDYGAAIVAAAISDLIKVGQEEGIFDAELPSFEVASYHVTAALLLITMHPELTTEDAQKLVIRQVMAALKNLPDDQGGSAK
jgi:AcrR family transcriptional regulator